MPPHTTTPARAAPVIGAATVNRSRSALARAGLALGVLAAAAAGTVAAGAGPRHPARVSVRGHAAPRLRRTAGA